MKKRTRSILVIFLSLLFVGFYFNHLYPKVGQSGYSLPETETRNQDSVNAKTSLSEFPESSVENTHLQTENELIIPENIRKELVCKPGISGSIAMDAVSLFIPVGAIRNEITLSVTALSMEDLPYIPPEISNVTKGYFAGYRFLPHGMRFDSAVTINMSFDESLLPEGFTPEDVFTFYYDEEDKKWKALQRESVDLVSGSIISKTLHFTDMINGIVKIPESPETEGYVPTTMNDMKAVVPSAEITQMSPPEPNNMGDAAISFPFDIPAGRKGIQPDLMLAYNSGGGSGWTGYGWSMDIQAIAVDVAWGVPRYMNGKESETYIFNGIHLTPVAHRDEYIDREAEKEFFLRKERDFSKILRHGNNPANYWWEITDKNGIRNYYGGTPESGVIPTAVSVDENNNIGYWALVKTVDLHDNFIRYSYDKPSAGGQQLYLSEIYYTGFRQEEGPYKIRFLRSDPANAYKRKDQSINARFGFIIKDQELLRRIIVSYNDDIVREYTLNYKEGAFFKTLLESVSVFNEKGEEFYTHNFEYYNDVQIDNEYTPYNTEKKWEVPDDELVFPYTNPLNIFMDNVSALGGSSSFGGSGSFSTTLGPLDGFLFSKSNTAGVNVNYQRSKSEGFLSLVDINGDGLSDKVYKKDGSIFYRPNLLGNGGNEMFGDSRPIEGIDNFSLSITNAFGGGPEAHVGVGNAASIFAGSDINVSTTKTSIYFSDFNADGLIDLAYDNTVYFNHINENGDPVFTTSSEPTPNPIFGKSDIDIGILPSAAEEQAELERQFPLHDAVRMWKAPFKGSINIRAPVNLVEDESNEARNDEYKDGVIVSIQHTNNELWRTEIGPADYSIKDPLLDSIEIEKGEQIYFRLQSNYNGSYDKVLWDPEIYYNDIDSDDSLPKLIDFNGKETGRFLASEDFIVSGDQSLGMPKDGAIHIKVSFSKPVTSDTVHLEIFHFDSLGNELAPLAIRKYNCEEEVSDDSVIIDLEVFENEYIQFKVFSETTIDWSEIICENYIEYTRTDDGTPVEDGNGNPIITFNAVPDFYFMFNHIVRQEFPAIVDSLFMSSLDLSPDDSTLKTVRIFPDLRFTDPGSPDPPENVLFAIKKNGRILESNTYTFSSDSLHNKDTLSVQIQKNDTLSFGFFFKDIELAEGTRSSKAVIISASEKVNRKDASVFSTIDPENEIFGKLYRGWGQFDYLGDSITTFSPIDESKLIPPNLDSIDFDEEPDSIDLAGIDTGKDIFNVMVPYAEKDLYMGTDEYVYVQSAYMSSSRQGEKNVVVDSIVISETGLTSVNRRSVEITTSGSVGAGYLAASGSASTSALISNLLFDMMDMNGDRYPDLVTPLKIQYTGVTGVLKGDPVDHNLGNHHSLAFSAGIVGGGSYAFAKSNNSATPETGSASGKKMNGANAKEASSKRNNKSGQAQETSSTALGFSANFTLNRDFVVATWVDINGDGLTDKIFLNGDVSLNLGYKFAEAENWGFDTVSAGKSRDIGGGLGISLGNGSFEAGVGTSYTQNESIYALLDVNADGLPDIVSNYKELELSFFDGWPPADIERNITVRFNTGSGFEPPIEWTDLGPLNMGASIGESANTGFTIGIPIPIVPPLKLCLNPSGSISHGVSKTMTQLADIDGDGMPDVLSSNSEGELYVKSSTIGRTNMLKRIDLPLGGTINLDYDYTPVTYEHPGGKLALTSVKVFDGLAGDGADTSFTAYDYANGYYDRHERQFYGFATVRTNDYDTEKNNALYRTTERKYSVNDYYTKGLLLEETILDHEGKKQRGFENTYSVLDTRSGEILPQRLAKSDRLSLFVALTEVKNYVYAGADMPGITTRETFSYDEKGNISNYTNYSSGNVNDWYTVNVQYHSNEDKYILSIPALHQVFGMDGLLRESNTSINEYGEIVQINQKISSEETAAYNIRYDEFGNITKLIRPANYKGERMWYEYDYDPQVHNYIIKIRDAYGYSSAAEYDYKYGVMLKATDKNSQSIQYSYDNFGRLLAITGPYDLAEGNSYSIAFEYHHNAEVPYARSLHWQSTYNTDIETISFIDGLERIVQLKKSALLFTNPETEDSPGFIVSGKTIYDAFGREVKQYQPVFENNSGSAVYSPNADNVEPEINSYDVLDRIRTITMPDGSVSQHFYGVGDLNGEPMQTDSLMDALNNVSLNFTKANGKVGGRIVISNSGEITTDFEYNGIGELKKVTDPNGNSTSLDYDMLGRNISMLQPEAGLTEFKYDAAGNLIKKITANLRKYIPDGGEIKYTYDLERLIEVVYPRTIQNRTEYTYGEPGAPYNRAGRLTLIQDASGGQEFFYSPLGQIVKTIRTVHLGESDMRTFIWSAEYDTWNRVLSMTYPDGEEVAYTYNMVGNLQKLEGEKLGRNYSYVSRIGYNKLEKQVYLEYGNGTVTTYSYEDKRQRLDQVLISSHGKDIVSKKYSYDPLSNILSIVSTDADQENLGGSITQNYIYDDLYRLANASGIYSDTENSANYLLELQYDKMGNITSKKLVHAMDDKIQDAISYNFDYEYNENKANIPDKIGDRIFKYDENGNQTYWEDQISNSYRQLGWDEENRLAMISDEGYLNRYVYDASGERVIKSHGGTRGVYLNGAPVGILNHSDNNYTVYLSPYCVFKKEGFTKHYYSGSVRLVSKIGNGQFRNQFRPGVFELTAGNINYINRQQQILASKKDYEEQLSLPPGPPTMKGLNSDPLLTGVAYPDIGTPDTVAPPGWPQQPIFAPPGGPPGAPIQWGESITNENVEPGFGYVGTGTIVEDLQYYYHTDHVGSTEYVTDVNGDVNQFIAYIPSGEIFVERHSAWDSPYKFNARELDGETGLYYYNDRYYDPKVNSWLSPDPYSLNAPEWSPYAFTYNNQVASFNPESGSSQENHLSRQEQNQNAVSNEPVGGVHNTEAGISISRGHIYSDNSNHPNNNRTDKNNTVKYEGFGGDIELTEGKTTTVLGRYDDKADGGGTKVFIEGNSADYVTGENTGGLNILNIQDWTWEKNAQWIMEAIERGDVFRFISDPTNEDNIYKNKETGEKTVTGQEIQLLEENGYRYDPVRSEYSKGNISD